MALPITLFPCIPLHPVTDEEFKQFYTIDRMLLKKLIYSLNRTFNDAIDVVAFLLWLEREKLSVNAVYKVLTEWPNHLVALLAEQVVALLKWLGEDVLVWGRHGDIFLIQELCHKVVSFIYMYQRRLEILEGKNLIRREMTERAFRETFPREDDNENVQAGVGLGTGARVGVRNVGGRVGYDSQNVVNLNTIGVPGPREVGLDNNNGRVGMEIGRGDGVQNVAGGLVYDPRERIHENQIRIQFGSIDGPQELENNAAVESVQTFVPEPLQYATTNQNLFRFGTIGDVLSDQELAHMINGVGLGRLGVIGRLAQAGGGSATEASSNNGRILSNMPYGPRMGYTETNGQIQRSDQVNTIRPIPESELSVLLRGLNINEEETDVHEDDRTVFLTFSRGYPLTEPEIWGFFTRRFGNFIKAIHFEEVGEGVQPLYALLVARNSSILPLICDINVRTKYVINGRHVWAKKYVRKHNAPPPCGISSSVSTSHQPEPET